MVKNTVLAALIEKLESDFKTLKHAALATYEDATHEESKPENKYDTRALEASYLAGAQAQRVADTAEILLFCQNLKIRNQNKVGIGALVEVISNEKINYFFYLPTGGGIMIQVDEKIISIISPASPLGKAIHGLEPGDIAEIEMNSIKKLYEIISVI